MHSGRHVLYHVRWWRRGASAAAISRVRKSSSKITAVGVPHVHASVTGGTSSPFLPLAIRLHLRFIGGDFIPLKYISYSSILLNFNMAFSQIHILDTFKTLIKYESAISGNFWAFYFFTHIKLWVLQINNFWTLYRICL